jgi:hypothetical protein
MTEQHNAPSDFWIIECTWSSLDIWIPVGCVYVEKWQAEREAENLEQTRLGWCCRVVLVQRVSLPSEVAADEMEASW